MEIVMKRTADIKPYPGNPRDNDNAVPYIAESIKQFGFRVPIVLDPDGVIVCGHTRWKAAQKLGIEEVPTVGVDDLTPEQIKRYQERFYTPEMFWGMDGRIVCLPLEVD